jgi:ATP-dependent helicase/DNAse subunit B
MPRIDIYKAYAWHEFIANQNQWRDPEPLVLIIPEGEDKLRLSSLFDDLKINAIFTIPELVERYLKNHGKKGLLSIHGLESILSSIIGENFTAYLKIEKYKQGYVKALTDFIYYFRKTAIMDLQTAIEQFKKEDQLTLKEKDLIKIHVEYEKRLPDYGHDLRSGVKAFIQNASGQNIKHYLGINDQERLVFFGFDYINSLAAEFIHTVFKNTDETGFLVCDDPAASEPAVRIQKNITNLLERVKADAVEHRLPALHPSDCMVSLSNALFQSNQPLPAPDSQPRVMITKENNRFSEIVSIARRISALGEQGVSLNSIRIIAPEYHLYGSIVREIFPEYGIPFYLEKGVPLLRFPLASFIHNLVNQSISPNPYALREKIFSSPYLSFVTEVNPSELVKYQEATGVELIPAARLRLFLQPKAQYRLDFAYTKNLRERAYQLVKPVREVNSLQVIQQYLMGLNWKDDLEKESAVFQCLIQFQLLARAEKELSSWRVRMSGAEFKDTLFGLLRRFKVEENIRLLENNGPYTLEPGIREQDLDILKQISKLCDQLILLLAPIRKPEDETVPLPELVRIFSRLMSETALSVERTLPRVTVQPVNLGQYQKWDYTFICGLVDGEFPGEDEFNFLHPKKEGLSLGNAYTSVDHARNHLFHLIRSTGRGLFLSLPLSDNGRKLPASPFVKEIEKCLPPAPPDSESLFNHRVQLYSMREKYSFIGKNIDDNYLQTLPLLKEIKVNSRTLFQRITAILRFDGLSLNPARFSEYDGIFSPGPALTDLLIKEINNITFTPTVFERYAGCPLRFLFDDIMHFKVEPDYHPDTAEAGLLIHAILKEYTVRAGATQGIPDEAERLIQEALEGYFQEKFSGAEDAFQMRLKNQLMAGLGPEKVGRPGLFYAYLQYEKNGPDLLKPYLANLAGSVKLKDGPEILVEIDRVDQTQAGDHFILFQYTVAGTGNPGKISRGLRFDLPLAILLFLDYASEKNLRSPVAGAGMYLVKSPKEIKRGGYFAKSGIRAFKQSSVSEQRPVFSGQREGFIEDPGFLPALEKIEEHLGKLYRLMKLGVFHLPLCSEADQICSNCSFGRACRKDQLRLERLRSNLRNEEELNVIREII